MGLDIQSRRLTHSKGGKISFTRTAPSSSSMTEGDLIFSIFQGKSVRLYAKFMGIAWYVPLVRLDAVNLVDDIVDTAASQRMRNKTIEEPVINKSVKGSAILDSDTMSGASATTLASSESIKAYADTNQYNYIRGAFNYNQSGGTQVCIPLDGGTVPKTAFTNSSENVCMIAPFDGTIEKILFRSEEVPGNPVVMGFHKVSDGTETPSMTATVSSSQNMSAVSADNKSVEFPFTSSNTFSAGDVLGFTCDPPNDVNDCIFMIVLKYDTTAGI